MAAAVHKDHHHRPCRSNSLQKMLELEKQAMAHRQQLAAAQQGPISIPYNMTSTPSSQRPMNSRSRRYSHTNVAHQRQSPPRQPLYPATTSTNNSQRILPLPQLPPLTVNFPEFDPQHGLSGASSSSQSRSSSASADRRKTLPSFTSSDSSLPQQQSDEDERQSVCISPSWEAYARAKQIKKDQKQDLKDHKAKRSKLSKQPPPLSTSAGFAAASVGQVPVMKRPAKNKSEVTMGVRGPVKERPASVVGLVAPQVEMPNKREGHTRSGSFSSILKAFDLRKHSEAEVPSTPGGFVGGIKLEQEKFEQGEKVGEHVNEKAIEAQEKLPSSTVHPALRDASVLGSSETTLHQTSPAFPSVPKVNLEQLTPAEETKSHKWRSYIGLRRNHHQKVDSKDSTTSTESKRTSKILISGPILSDEAEAKVAETLAKAGGSETSTPPLPPQPTMLFELEDSVPALPLRHAMHVVPEATISVSPPSPEAKTRLSERLEASRSQRARRQQRRLQQADELDMPPPPPRRSSKRKSWIALDAPSPSGPRIALSAANDTMLPPREHTLSERPSSIQLSPPASPRPHQHRHTSSYGSSSSATPSLIDHDHLKPNSLLLQHSTCSEDSASDYSHPLYDPSTPPSSRPQSDSELSPVIADIERFFLDDGPYRNEDGQAGEDLKEITIRQPSLRRRSRDGRLVLDPGFVVPQLETQTSDKKQLRRSFPLVTRKPATETEGHVAPLFPATAVAPKPAEQTNANSKEAAKPVAKVFVECCGCKYYHDLPSKLYEAISAARDQNQAGMTVRCPWCKHGMSRQCCAGLAAMVYVKERLH